MAKYIKTDWQSGDTITSEKMNKIENTLDSLSNQVDSVSAEVDNVSDRVDGINLGNYYTKNEVYNKDETYKKTEVYSRSDVYKKSEVYTKSEIDEKMDNIVIPDGGGGTTVDLSNYYTKNQVYSKSETYNKNEVFNKNEVYNKDLTYTKGEVNALIDAIDQNTGGGTSVDLSNYYTKSQVYNKVEVDAKIDAIGPGSGGGGTLSNDPGVVNVKDYGAVGDGVTDDSQAIRNAITYMCSFAKQCTPEMGWKSYMPTLYFPNGRYLVSQKGVFNCIGAALQGYNIKGAGYLNSEILYTYNSAADPDGGYLLTNGDDNWFGFSYIEDLTIRGTGNNNFWRIKSQPGSPQANRFRRVAFYNLNRCVTVEFGTHNYNADLFRFESCKASEIYGWIFGVSDATIAQSVVHTFRDCDFENIHGYGVYMRSGGTIEVRGGSWIATKTGRMFHFEDITGSGIGTSNRNISIYGTKFEYQYYDGSDSNLDYYPLFYNDSRMVISFYGCNFAQFSYAGNSNKANYGYLGIMGSVYFFNCQIPPVFGIKTNPSLSVAMDNIDQRPMIFFKDCIMYSTLDTIVTQVNNNEYQGGAYTDVVAEDCYSSKPNGNVQLNTQLNQGYGNRTIPSKKKMAVLTKSTNFVTSLPCDGASFSYKFPKGSIITDVTIYFRNLPGTTGSNTITVTNKSGKTLASGSHVGNDPAISVKGTNIFEVVETSDYEIIVTGTGENPNGGIGGFVAVEYY